MANGSLDFKGIDLTHPINRIRAGAVAVAVNVRSYGRGWIGLRNVLTAAILTVGGAVNSIARLNDTTPAGPVAGYSIISADALGNLYCGAAKVATGLSGNPISLIAFRPNASVQPWMYQADSAPQGNVTLITKYLINGVPVNFVTNGMNKVRSDGTAYKTGIKEPQLAPTVTTNNTSVSVTGNLLSTAIPWTNYLGANSSYSYGETNGYPKPAPDGTAPFVINVANATTVTITSLTGLATINGNANVGPTNNAVPPSLNPALSTNPGHYVMAQGTGVTPPSAASVVIGAFCDSLGNVVAAGVGYRSTFLP
jgi:hypothetical protein